MNVACNFELLEKPLPVEARKGSKLFEIFTSIHHFAYLPDIVHGVALMNHNFAGWTKVFIL